MQKQTANNSLKNELWNSIEDPRDIYKKEIFRDMKYILSMNKQEREFIFRIINAEIEGKELLNDVKLYKKAQKINKFSSLKKKQFIELLTAFSGYYPAKITSDMLRRLLEVWGNPKWAEKTPKNNIPSYHESDIPNDVTMPYILKFHDGEFVIDRLPYNWVKIEKYHMEAKEEFFKKNIDWAFSQLVFFPTTTPPEKCLTRLPLFRYMILKIIELNGPIRIKINGEETKSYHETVYISHDYSFKGWRTYNMYSFWMKWFSEIPEVTLYRGKEVPEAFKKKVEAATGKEFKEFFAAGGFL